MDINNLKAFLEVADRKSFSRSAESLKLTQPAVSKRIAALEAELSARLFDRVGRSVHLTEAGRVLLPAARQISTELTRIEDVICNLGKEISGTLSIGTTEHIGAHHLPEVLQRFRRAHPNAHIQLRFAPSHETLKLVEKGMLEMALCSVPDKQKLSAKLQSAEIWSDQMAVVVGHDHPLAREQHVPLNLLVESAAILPPKSTIARHSIDNLLLGNNETAKVSMEVADYETMRTMASIGLGWACLPEFQVDDSLVVLQVEKMQLKSSVALVRNHERTLSRAAQAFAEALPVLQA